MLAACGIRANELLIRQEKDAAMDKFDVVVIGSGPGGEGAAMTAAKSGLSVAVVDKFDAIGGGCVHWGTIPSKTLRHSIGEYQNFKSSPLFSRCLEGFEVSYEELLSHAKTVVRRQVKMRRGFYDRNEVRCYDGHARFTDNNTVIIENEGGQVESIQGKKFVIAVGTRPYHPKDVDFSHPRILDSNSVLTLNCTPQSITIYGAGVIGCEYASIFRNLGCKVNLVNNRDKLLAFLDDEIIDALSYHLRDQGALIRHNETYESVEATDDEVVLKLKSGKVLKSQYFLWANGRSGNTDKLGLDTIGVETNSRAQIDVNEVYQTPIEHVYAVGDVIGFPGLASAAYDQGRFAATHLVTGACDRRLVENIPSGIYTLPEISSIGPTERQLTEECVPYEVGHALFRSLARAQIVDVRVGMLKLLFHRETYELLAIHCFGYQAAEIVHIGQAIMSLPPPANDIRYFANTTFNYPTMAEAYRVAALNGLNRL